MLVEKIKEEKEDMGNKSLFLKRLERVRKLLSEDLKDA
jgi:hypothetical protein